MVSALPALLIPRIPAPACRHCRFLAAPFDYITEAICKSGCGSQWDDDGLNESRRENIMMGPIAPCLWFDDNAEEAVNYYV